MERVGGPYSQLLPKICLGAPLIHSCKRSISPSTQTIQTFVFISITWVHMTKGPLWTTGSPIGFPAIKTRWPSASLEIDLGFHFIWKRTNPSPPNLERHIDEKTITPLQHLSSQRFLLTAGREQCGEQPLLFPQTGTPPGERDGCKKERTWTGKWQMIGALLLLKDRYETLSVVS